MAGAAPAGGAKPSVAHLVTTYLGFTETFLHHQFRAHDRYEPWIYAWRTANLDRFPTDRLDIGPAGIVGRAFAAVGSHWNPGFVKRMRERNTAVVHAHFGTTAVGALPLAALHRWPLVVSFYGYDVAYLREPVRRHPERAAYAALAPLLFRVASRIVALSEEMKRELVSLGAPEFRVEVLHNGVDVSRFAPASGSRDAGPPAVLMCGREVEKKGFEFGLEALARVRSRGVAFRILLHGTPNGPLRSRLLQQVSALGLGDLFADVDPRQPTWEVMRRAAVILAPSVTAADGDREGVPTVLVEAAAAGLPAVASRHAGIPEIVLDGQTGILCPERDVEALAAALETLVGDAPRRALMGEAARMHVLAGWDAARIAARREEIYDEVRGLTR